MKKNYFFIFVLFFSYSFGYSQNIGDFRSKNIGASIWNDTSSWETWNGSWASASSYPGQNTGTYTVTISSNTTITIPSDLSTTSMGNLIVNGTLVLGNGTSDQHITILSTKLLTINPTGALTFSGVKVRLILPASDAVLIIEPSGTINGSCTNNDELFVDTNKYATCVGSGSNTYSFGELIASGGNVNTKITYPVANSVAVSGCSLINLSGGYDGIETNVTYQWKVRKPNGSTTLLNSGILVNNTETTSTSFTPDLQGEYLVSLEITTSSLATNVETRTFNVVDTTNPTISCPANIIQNVDAGTCGAVVTYTSPVGTDNCSGATTTQTSGLASGANFPVGTTTNTFKVTDAAGLETSCSFTVTVVDNQVPTLTAIAARNENLGAACSFAIPDYTGLTTAADNCTAAGSIIKTQLPVLGTLISGHNTTQLITITANDGNGNTESTTFTITLKDVTAPATPTLTDVNVGQCNGTPVAPTTTDNCAGTVTGTTVTVFPITTQGVTVVTWTFADGNGNSTTANQNVTVDDTIKPTLTAIAARNENLGAACSFAIPDYTGLTTAADNCTAAGSIVKTQLPVSGTLISGHNTTQLITITANDGNGNTESTTFTITLKDVTAPATPTLTDVNIGQCGGTPVAPTTTDACAGTITGTPNVSFPITTQGTTVVTWSFADGNGNSTTANQNVTVDDTIKPTLTAIAARNENLGAACSFAIPDYTGLTTAADNCTAAGSIIKTQLPVSGTVISGHNTTQLITITANDGNGNTESTTFTITLKDVTAPATPTLTAVNIGQCGGTPVAPTTTDACAGTITGTPNVSFPITTQGTTVVTWSFADGNGNSTTANQNVTVDDTIKPTLTAIAARNENLGAACSFAIPDYTGLTTAADNCTAAGSIIKTQLPVSGTVISGHNTTQLITITANDGNGNTESTTFTITLKDVTAPATPTLTAVNIGQCGGTPVAPTTTDACAGTITGTPNVSFPITTQGTTVVTWSFADGNGNSTTANQNVTVDDTIKPTLTAIAARNENLGAACSFAIPDYTGLTTAADNCTAAGSIIKTQLPVSGTVISGHNTTQLITITANDGNGNTESTTFTITLKDVTAPSITTLTAISVNADAGVCTYASSQLTPPTASDNCTTVTVTYSPASLAKGLNTVTWTATDAAGLMATSNQSVTVIDNQAPTIATLTAVSVNADAGFCTYASSQLTPPTASDNCTTVTVTRSPASLVKGLNTVTWTATDAAGLTATSNQSVTVIDNQLPVISCPANISVNNAPGTCGAIVTYVAPVRTDNCSGATLTQIAGLASGATFPIGITTNTFRVTDATGLQSSCSFTVTVIDNQAPTLTTGTSQSAFTAAGLCTASVAVPNATFGDNCTAATITYTLSGATTKTITAGQIGTYTFNKGITTITYTVTDGASPPNTTTATKTVTVDDNIAPIVTLSDVTAQCSATLTAPTASDNCAGTVTGTTNDAITYNTQGTFAVTWSFNDGNGNVTTRTQNVIIDDTIVPVANVTSLPTLSITGCQIDTLTPPTANDNCKGTISGTTTSLPITTQGTTIITWTYDDGNGNLTLQTQSIKLTAPSISGGNLKGFVSGLTPAMTPTDNIAITSCINEINPITLNLSGQTGTIIHWEKFEAGDTTWSIIANTSNSYNIVFNFSNSKSTLFRVLIQVGSCTRYSNIVNVHSIPPDVAPTLNQTNFNICLNNTVTLVATTGFYSTIDLGDGGDFNSGQFPDKWDPTQWKIDGEVAGAQWTAAGNNTKYNNWSGTNDHPVGTLYKIKYDSNDLKFGIAHGNFNSPEYINQFGVGPTTLETPIFSLAGLKTAAVQFDQAYNLHAGDYAKLELSLDGGLTYTVVLQNLIGTSPHALSWGDTHSTPVPYPYQAPTSNNSTTTYFNFQNDNSSFDISQYIGNTNVRVKWTFFGTTDESTWAVDNISIPLRSIGDAIEWTDGIGTPGEYIIRDPLAASYTFTPSAPGVHQYGATSLINGCRAYDATGTAIATVKVNYAYAGEAIGYTNAECGERTVQLNAYDNTKSANDNKVSGSYPLALNTFSDDPGTGETGKWSVVSNTNTCGTYSFSNILNPSSTFSGDAGVYTLRWTLDVSGCYSDVQVTLTNCNNVNFDGSDDYLTFKNNYGLGNDFSIEVWVKPNPQPANPISNIQTILSKRNANNLIDGYDLRLTGSTLSFNWNNGSQIVSPFSLTTSRWYHVAVTRNSGMYRLYVDGIEVVSAAGSAPITNTSDCIAGAMDKTGSGLNRPVNHFSGWMDELRIWNTGLAPDHVRQMMNQQIVNNGTAVRGEIIPLDIKGPDTNKDGIDDQPISWTNLIGYYRMNQIACGYLNPFGGKGVDGKLRNITSSQQETAPLPYLSIRDGNWMDKGAGTTPWKYGDSVWDYPNSTGYNGTPIDWNIVQTAHNINSGNKDITVLGLISTAGKLTIADPVVTAPIENNDGQSIWITHYLKLNGTIDLVGESQLVQKRYLPTQFNESILDVTSSGYLERDQQGKKNSFNYNYWSSPVSNIQGIINNTTHSPASVLRDGTISSTPKNITFGDGAFFADGTLSNPILTSNRWIWSYNSTTLESNTELQDYNQWNYIGNAGLLKTGEGFTMKGTGGTAPIDASQNYVFVGKPNNGDIALPLPYDQTYLVGNPYPSALDADEFIDDNLAGRAGVNVFNGALYFWDHFGLSNNHNLAEYEGAYATYTKVGGVKGIATSSLTAGGTGTKVPQRYIPVGQGFFVDAYLDPTLSGAESIVSGGTLKFKNSQRVFMRESTPNSVFMKTRASTKTSNATKPKIRLGFDSSVGAHRQLLLGSDPNTTDLFDLGYDAPMFDTNENDIFWEINDSQFVIQGVPDFNTSRIIPLGVVVANEGEVTIKIDETENLPSSTQIYLHDAETGIYHDLKNSTFKTALATGNYDHRFSLTFESLATTSTTLDVAENNSNDGIIVLYSNNYKMLIIKNNIPDSTINTVSLYNILGQSISKWDLEDKEQTNIQIPIKNLPSGIYVAKIKTSKGESSKKIIVN